MQQTPDKPDMAGQRIYTYLFLGVALIALLYLYLFTSDVKTMQKRAYGQQRIEASELPKK